ncbi:hypothetical protein WAK64_22215 [Bacillus spongiae]|uniref:Uncharacterized protein n=1 Tax=Bacillus spongiae TaxID=2683610 RepID=A0ABU8HL28_9BACI
MKKTIRKIALSLTVATGLFSFSIGSASAASDSETLTLPSGYGTLKSDAWRGSLTTSGNTYKFDYQTSAVYSGSYNVEYIKTTWEVCASLRNSATMSIGISSTGVTAGAGSTWQNKCDSAYWQNSNGATGAYSERRNAVIKPSVDYRSGTVSLQNEAKLKIKGDARSWTVNAAT